uniref:Uncharacterized protein n=1 Tax=Anguilla anguilla TaxID=7936 RepID=A0A0E9V6M2_ANGAN
MDTVYSNKMHYRLHYLLYSIIIIVEIICVFGG